MGSKEARATVRARRARIEAERKAREKRMDATAEKYVERQGKIDAAAAKAARAIAETEKVREEQSVGMDADIAELLTEHNAKPAEVAELLDLTPAEVNAAARRHSERSTNKAATATKDPDPPAGHAADTAASGQEQVA